MTKQSFQTCAVADVKARLSEYLRKVEHGEPLVITRNGKPVAALICADALAQIQRLRAAGPQAGLAGLAGGWDGSEQLVALIESSHRSGPRQVPELDD